jgi:hypothetical protein
MRLTLLSLFLPVLALGANRIDLTTTETSDLAPGGTVRIEHSTGELNVEGWDQPTVQIEVTRYTWSAKTNLKEIQIAKKLEGNVLTIDTAHKRFTGAHVDYRIRVPRNTKLVIHHGIGDVTIYDMTADIEATAKEGDLIVGLPEPAKYQITAHTKIGTIYNDFQASEPDGHHITLRVGTGGISIVKETKATS